MSTDDPGRTSRPRKARLPRGGRAFSLLELTAVIAVVGLLAAMAVTRFGGAALASARGEGIARQLALSLAYARNQAIADGAPGAVVLSRSGGTVVSWRVVRGGLFGTPIDEETLLPADVTITAPYDFWFFNYGGALTAPPAGGTLRVDAPGWYWNVQVYAATGGVTVTRVANP